jgi:hypothetical protein
MSTDTPWSTPRPPVPEEPAPEAPGSSAPSLALRDDLRAGAITALIALVLAFPVGALWRWVSPPVVGVFSQHVAYYAEPEGKTFIARDGWFAVFACIAALLVSVFAFVRYRKGPSAGAAVGLAGGGIGAAYLAAWFGAYIGPGQGSTARAVAGVADGATFDLPLTVRATGVIWLWPAVAVGLFFFLMLLFGPSEQRAPEFPGWGAEQAVPPAPASALPPESAPPAAGPEHGTSGSPSASV